LAALKLFIVQYQTEVPMRAREFPPNSHKWISGSDQSNGQIEVKLKPGQTAYFGAWVEGFMIKGEKGFFRPEPIIDPWCPQHAITFSVYMPERSDSLKSMQDREQIEKTLSLIRQHQQKGQPQQRETPQAAEMRRINTANFMTQFI
jgi:hypothetical protein